MTDFYLIALLPGGYPDWLATFHSLDACMKAATGTGWACVDLVALGMFN